MLHLREFFSPSSHQNPASGDQARRGSAEAVFQSVYMIDWLLAIHEYGKVFEDDRTTSSV